MDILSASNFTSFGFCMSEKNHSTPSYRYSFQGKEKNSEWNEGSYDFGARIYDGRSGRWLAVDPKAFKLAAFSPYNFCNNSPIISVDPDGQFPILINGRVSNDGERASWKYWDKKVRETIKAKTGYYHSQFKYVDGDKGQMPSTRVEAGTIKGKADAAAVYAILKASAVDGKITEQLQIFSHSRGGAFAAGYMDGLTAEVKKLAAADNLGFAYGEENIIEYSVNLAPHQSNWIDQKTSKKNVNISHIGDPLSGDDATGNAVNVESIPEQDQFDQHGNATYNTELGVVLEALEKNTDAATLTAEIKKAYQTYDKGRTNGGTSTVTKSVE